MAEQSAPASRERTWEEEGLGDKRAVPEGLWTQCDGCGETLFRKALESNLMVCPKCDLHMRISGTQRIAQLLDEGSFEPMDANLTANDPLGFVDMKAYPDRIKAAQRSSGQPEGLISGTGFVKGRKVVVCVMDFSFLAGSMGSVVGEKITRATLHALEHGLPLIIVSCSGGARMQESGLSLMQMAKTSAALARLDDAGGLFISLLTDPTTGGVTASFAMLGDVIIAEPKALIGFAGPRVIKQTIRQDLPDGFQTSEFLLNAGFIDRIVHRSALRSEIARLIDFAG